MEKVYGFCIYRIGNICVYVEVSSQIFEKNQTRLMILKLTHTFWHKFDHYTACKSASVYCIVKQDKVLFGKRL